MFSLIWSYENAERTKWKRLPDIWQRSNALDIGCSLLLYSLIELTGGGFNSLDFCHLDMTRQQRSLFFLLSFYFSFDCDDCLEKSRPQNPRQKFRYKLTWKVNPEYISRQWSTRRHWTLKTTGKKHMNCVLFLFKTFQRKSFFFI